MATTTTHYGFDIPQSTDLVKDGATAIATLGQDIDTAMNTALGTNKAGLVLLNTTSFSAVASQAFNSVFSATYDNYRIIFDGVSSTSNSLNLRYRSGTTDDTSSNYIFQDIYAAGTSLNTARTTDTSVQLGMDTTRTFVVMDIASVFAATATGGIRSITRFYNNATPGGLFGTFNHNVATSYNGFNLIASTGTITGKVSVYGYNL